MSNKPKIPSSPFWMLIALFTMSIAVGMGFSFGSAIGWDLASLFGFAVG